jgi:hypothetical protein
MTTGSDLADDGNRVRPSQSMQPGSEIVPARGTEIVRARPRWRRAIEGGTQLAVGLGAVAIDAAGGHDSPARPGAGGWGDALLGMTLATQRRALDVTERVVDAGTGIAQVVSATPVARAVIEPAHRMVQPFEARGRAARTDAVETARVVAPEYASRMVDTVVDVVSIDDVLAHVDLDALLNRIDVQGIIDRVDVQGIIDRVDIDALMGRVDIDALMARVDIAALLDRVDVNEIIEQVDVESLVERTELGAIIAKSTGGVASEALDLVRRQGVGLDGFLFRWAQRIRRRGLKNAPTGPPLLVAVEDPPAASEAASA